MSTGNKVEYDKVLADAKEAVHLMKVFSPSANTVPFEAVIKLADTLAERCAELEAALVKLRDCDFVITPADRMDAVRDIARAALGGGETKEYHKQRDEARADNKRLAERCAELERALNNYGVHKFHCGVVAGECTCGLTQAALGGER